MFQGSGKSQIIWDATFALIAMGAITTVSILGHIATQPNLSPWFAGLVKPSFYPPNWVFGPVWTTLYALMVFALWRILRLRSSNARTVALFLFFLQLALNAAWSWMFFWAHSPLPGAKFESAGHRHGDRTHDAKPDEGEDLRTTTKIVAGREFALR
jgi:tryptophan-rich sensory protein